MLIEDLFRPRWYEEMNEVIKNMVNGVISDEQILLNEISEWESSEKRKMMIQGDNYYRNKMTIDEKKRDIEWKSNLKLKHGFLRKLVDQKIGYALSKEPSITSENEAYQKLLDDVFDAGMLNRIRKVAKEAINKGVSYLHPYINEKGELHFKRLPSEQVIPFYADTERMRVDGFLYVYEESYYEGLVKKTRKKVEYHHHNGVNFYVVDGAHLIPDVLEDISRDYHFMLGEQKLLWEHIPLIHFRYNEEEQPLVELVQSLVDNINTQASVNADLLADIPNFIYKLVNYGGTDLAEFLSDLMKYRVIKLDTDGDLDKLQADIQTDAVEKDIARSRKAIYEFGRGVDTTVEDLGNASGVALRFRYADLDTDCNNLESEMLSSIEHMLWFITHYKSMIGEGDFTEEKIKFVFNRDIIINEAETVEMCEKSVGIIDDKTNRENHPWYTPEVEDRLKEQQAEEKKQMEDYQDMFKQQSAASDEDVSDDEAQ